MEEVRSMLARTVRDPERRTPAFEGLAATVSPLIPGTAAPGAPVPKPLQEWPRELEPLEFVGWLESAGTGEVDRVALARSPEEPKGVVVKFYRPGYAPRPGVWEAWQLIQHPNVASLLRSGRIGGRAYEVMPDLGDPLGADPLSRRLTLRDVLLRHPEGLPEPIVTDLVRQLSAAIEALGETGLAHLDLRPENVLAQQNTSEPGWAITLIDFGISAVVPVGSGERTSRATTPYSSPDVLIGAASLGSDYWSLGIMTAELATGSHRFLKLPQSDIELQLNANNAPAPPGLPDHLLQLYRGLTAREPDRWDAPRVRDWLAGNDVPPPPKREVDPRAPFRFRDEDYVHPDALAFALQKAWPEAADVLTGPQADRWDELAQWLKQFDRPGKDSAQALVAIRRWDRRRDPASPDARLLLLLCWMAPDLEDRRYRGARIDLARLPQLALAALPVADDPADAGWEEEGQVASSLAREVVEDLWRWPLLPEIESVYGLRGAAEVDGRWRELHRQWTIVIGLLEERRSPLVMYLRELRGLDLAATLLRLASSPTYLDYLRRELADTEGLLRGRAGGSYQDFDVFVAAVLRNGAQGDSSAVAVGLLTVHRLQGVVRQRIAQEADALGRHVRAEGILDLAWQRRERWRVLERPVALGWAAAAMAVVGLSWAAVFILSESLPESWPVLPHPETAALTLAWGVVGVCLGAQSAVELWLAGLIGAPYHRGYSMAFALVGLGGAVGRLSGQNYLGAAIVLVVGAAVGLGLLALVLTVPYLLPIPTVIAHLWWARRRHQRWVSDHRALREQFT
jgi:hypothetical protein